MHLSIINLKNQYCDHSDTEYRSTLIKIKTIERCIEQIYIFINFKMHTINS